MRYPKKKIEIIQAYPIEVSTASHLQADRLTRAVQAQVFIHSSSFGIALESLSLVLDR